MHLRLSEKDNDNENNFCIYGNVFWVLARRNLSLGQATALFQSSVIFVTIIFPFLLQETVGIYRWSSVVLGRLGILLLTAPFSGTNSYSIIYDLLLAISNALLSVALSRLGKAYHWLSVSLINSFSAALLMICQLILSPVSHLVINSNVAQDLILLGLVTSVSQVFLTGAYHYVDAVIVTSLRYIQVPLAGVVTFILFEELITKSEAFGLEIVVLSFLIIGWREVQHKND